MVVFHLLRTQIYDSHYRRRAALLKHELTVSGLGSTTFDAAVGAIEAIYTYLEREFDEGQLIPSDVVKEGRQFG